MNDIKLFETLLKWYENNKFNKCDKCEDTYFGESISRNLCKGCATKQLGKGKTFKKGLTLKP